MHKYPDYILYMEQQASALLNFRNYLFGEEPEDRIKCLEPVEWRSGCH